MDFEANLKKRKEIIDSINTLQRTIKSEMDGDWFDTSWVLIKRWSEEIDKFMNELKKYEIFEKVSLRSVYFSDLPKEVCDSLRYSNLDFNRRNIYIPVVIHEKYLDDEDNTVYNTWFLEHGAFENETILVRT